jgi:hypothetical protein
MREELFLAGYICAALIITSTSFGALLVALA